MSKYTLAPKAKTDLTEIWKYITKDNEAAAGELPRSKLTGYHSIGDQLTTFHSNDFPADPKWFSVAPRPTNHYHLQISRFNFEIINSGGQGAPLNRWFDFLGPVFLDLVLRLR